MCEIVTIVRNVHNQCNGQLSKHKSKSRQLINCADKHPDFLFSNVKAVVGSFNEKKALIAAFSECCEILFYIDVTIVTH